MNPKGNPTLEKYELLFNYSKRDNGLSSQDIGRKLNEIDYNYRSNDAKLVENILRRGGKAIMLAGLVSFIGGISFMNYKAYKCLSDPSYARQHKNDSQDKWLIGSVIITYLGNELYIRRRTEWDQFEKNSK